MARGERVLMVGPLAVLWVFGGQFFFFEWAFTQVDFASAVHRAWPRTLAYFCETLVVESVVWLVVTRKRHGLPRTRLLGGILLANILSYAVLYPLTVIGLSYDS
jgi:hypothetical protein